MFERVERETLTDEIIKKDLSQARSTLFFIKNEVHGNNAYFFMIAAFLLVGFWIWFYPKLSPWFLPVFPLPLLIYGIYQTVRYQKHRAEKNAELKKIQEEGFAVSLETLSHTQATTIYEPHYGRRHVHSMREITNLYFEDGGSFRVLPIRYYSWSKTYHLSPEGLINTSVAGNTFYVVRSLNSGEIGYVYNTKFFIYNK